MAKRKMAARVPDVPPETLKVTLLSSSLLLVEIPADTNTSLPVWEAIRSQHVDVAWAVRPYSITVHFTPAPSKERKSKRTVNVGQTSAFSPIAQQHGTCQNVLLTFPQSITQLPAQPKAKSVTMCLPLVFTQAQPARQPGIPTLIAAPIPNRTQTVPSPFHTKFSSEVKICDNFLLNSCSKGGKCRKHHTPYPFHWQLWCVTNHQWVNISLCSQVMLERLYCSASHDVIHINDGNSRYTFSCDSMELDDSPKYNAIRRLENSADESENCYFPSRWKFYWCNNFLWEEYDKNLSTFLQKKMHQRECFFHIGLQEYKLNFTRMIQTNLKTGFERRVRCRPMYRSPDSMQPHLKTGVTEPIEATSSCPEANFNVDPLEEFSSWYPPVWRLPLEEHSVVDVPAGTLAYRRIQNLFYESMPETSVDIISIQQIQNLLHWDRYQRQKVYMQKQRIRSRELLERHLFHGTSQEAAVDICHNNFDPRMAGVNGTALGFGSYFATTSLYSDAFSVKMGSGEEVRHMFLAKVLVGKVCIGRESLHRPPPVHSRMKYILYDACVNCTDTPTMFAVFDRCQCYPYYLIKYKDLPQEVDI